ncbi:hypothetical protein [Sphingomonas sp.]|uniref:hypothetical protein n=1 Tax=Sphingomonas sp. TaxID=28214 RepID=UPI003AFFA894
MHWRIILAVGCTIAATACHRKPERTALDAVDNELVNGAVTPESKGAKSLREAIRVDPARAGGRTRTASASMAARASAAGDGACLSRYGSQLGSDKAWAGKLPAEFPAAPNATITEAAGHDGGCAIRIVSYAVRGTPDAALGWYAGKAKAGGYTADRADTGGDKVLAGTRGAAAFYIMAGAPQGGTTPVDLVWAATG